MIPQDTIEQVRAATDIVDIIGQYLRLKKRGRNFLALCPFHTEKTPSFSVSQDKQIYHCFGCGKGGNVFTFLMEHENMTFVEAVKFLAEKAGIRIVEDKTDDRTKEMYERLHYAHQVALDYFKETLYSDRYREPILKYLRKQRHLSDKAIEFFQLGLAGEEWDGFLRYAQKKDLFPKELHQAGLAAYSERKDRYYDRFRQRLMIPIFNLSGKPIAFGGRALKKGEMAKYINSPETPLYNKSTVLYGLNFTRQDIRDTSEVIVVEGYFDLISLWQAGIKNVVASSGTAFTSRQARLLARFAETVYLFFDADSAGQNAAVRSVDALYDAGLEVMVMNAPEGDDPDSLAVREGSEGIMQLKDSARRYIQFRLEQFDLENAGIIAKEKLIKELRDVSGRIQDDTRRNLFIKEAADLLGVETNMFLGGSRHSDRAKKNAAASKGQPKKIADLEKDLIALIIQNPDHVELVRGKMHQDYFQDEGMRKLFGLILTLTKSHEVVAQAALVDMLNDDSELISQVTNLASIDFPERNTEFAINDTVRTLLDYRREKKIDQLKEDRKMAQQQGDMNRAEEIEKEILALIKKRGE